MYVPRVRRTAPLQNRVTPTGEVLDEAIALAAGHRPCAYCRRPAFAAFAAAWRAGQGLAEPPRASQIDDRLHLERVDPRSRRQLTRSAIVGELPDGVMIRHAGAAGLLLGASILPWSFAGYRDRIALSPTTSVELLTPPATAAAIAAGYRPILHPSAGAGLTPTGG